MNCGLFSQLTPLFHLFPSVLSCFQQERKSLISLAQGGWGFLLPSIPHPSRGSSSSLGLWQTEGPLKNRMGSSWQILTQTVGKKFPSPCFLTRAERNKENQRACLCSQGGGCLRGLGEVASGTRVESLSTDAGQEEYLSVQAGGSSGQRRREDAS